MTNNLKDHIPGSQQESRGQSFRFFAAELKKSLRLFIADPKPLAAGIIASSMVLIVFTLIFGNFSSLPISIINKEQGPEGRKLRNYILSQI